MKTPQFGLGEIGFNGDHKIYMVDENGNQQEVNIATTSVEWTMPSTNTGSYQPTTPMVTVTGVCTGTKGIDIAYNPQPTSLFGNLDANAVLEMAMSEHSTLQSDKCDEGSIYFAENGNLFISYEMPCNNRLQISVTSRNNANESCDDALHVLEQMKERIEEIQKKLFELSLSQGIEEK